MDDWQGKLNDTAYGCKLLHWWLSCSLGLKLDSVQELYKMGTAVIVVDDAAFKVTKATLMQKAQCLQNHEPTAARGCESDIRNLGNHSSMIIDESILDSVLSSLFQI